MCPSRIWPTGDSSTMANDKFMATSETSASSSPTFEMPQWSMITPILGVWVGVRTISIQSSVMYVCFPVAKVLSSKLCHRLLILVSQLMQPMKD